MVELVKWKVQARIYCTASVIIHENFLSRGYCNPRFREDPKSHCDPHSICLRVEAWKGVGNVRCS